MFTRASDIRIETTLRHIGHAIGFVDNLTSGQASDSIQNRLNDLQDSQNAILSLIKTANSIMPYTSDSMLGIGPATVLDESQNFFPERYTLESRIPDSCIMILQSYEESSTVDLRTNVYRSLYYKSPRRWQWLTIHVEVRRCSKYWNATKISPVARRWSHPVVGLAATLPPALLTHLQRSLGESGHRHDQQRIRPSFSDDVTCEEIIVDATPESFLRASSSSLQSQDIMGYIRDLGCARYFESQVVQLEIIDPPSRFQSCINGILVYEIRPLEYHPNVEFLYEIRVLHCMKGAPGFARLI